MTKIEITTDVLDDFYCELQESKHLEKDEIFFRKIKGMLIHIIEDSFDNKNVIRDKHEEDIIYIYNYINQLKE